MKMSENSVVLSFLDFLSRPNKPLPKWMMHCKWGAFMCVSIDIHNIFWENGHLRMQARIQILTMCSKEGDLATLSSLGHFLKGSSATLGLTKVKDSCEKIQHYGQKKDEAGTTDEPDEEKCLARIKETLESVKEEYEEVEKVLKKFYAT